MKEYEEVKLNGGVPQWLKMLMIFIDRVGFPVLAFCLMFAVCWFSLEKMTCALLENTKALLELKTASTSFYTKALADHHDISQDLKRVMMRDIPSGG